MNAIEITGLVKKYGLFPAVKGISFQVKKNEIFGLIGPNAAGKTTTLRILATLLQPTKGSVTVFGFDVTSESSRIREIISYLPEDAGAYKNLTGMEYLQFIAHFFGQGKKKDAIVKKGEHGSILYNREFRTFFTLPAYVLKSVVDPTGAGDSFAGGFLGYIAHKQSLEEAVFRSAVAFGTCIASFCCEDFGVKRLAALNISEVQNRVREFRNSTSFD